MKSAGSSSLLYSLSSLRKILKKISQFSPFDHATWQHPRENPRHVRGSARIYDVRMAQVALKKEILSHFMGARGSQDLRSPTLIMAPVWTSKGSRKNCKYFVTNSFVTEVYTKTNWCKCSNDINLVHIQSLEIGDGVGRDMVGLLYIYM